MFLRHVFWREGKNTSFQGPGIGTTNISGAFPEHPHVPMNIPCCWAETGRKPPACRFGTPESPLPGVQWHIGMYDAALESCKARLRTGLPALAVTHVDAGGGPAPKVCWCFLCCHVRTLFGLETLYKKTLERTQNRTCKS